MAVNVRFFAALRERVGQDSVSLTTASDLDLRELLDVLGQHLGKELLAALTAPNVRIALNREFVEGQFTVRDGDEVAFMPPITGG